MNKNELKIIKEKMSEISNIIMELKSKIITEEATKQSLILPFFQSLKYNVFNPVEFSPEYNADFGIKKGEKVDYAIMLDGKLSILVEAKSCNVKLDKHAGQLSRYFNNSDAPVGILTNGIEYRFFSDIEALNRMDEEPFYVLNMLEVRDQDIEFLYGFLKTEFSAIKIKDLAMDLKDRKKIRDIITEELLNPSNEFVNVIMSSINNKRKTASYISKYKPVIKELIDENIREVAIKKIEKEIENPLVSPSKPLNKVVTTEEELVAYGLILGLMSDVMDVGGISYKDTENYLNILLAGNVKMWICRLYLNGAKKYIIFADLEKVFIDDIGDLINLKNKLIDAVRLRIK